MNTLKQAMTIAGSQDDQERIRRLLEEPARGTVLVLNAEQTAHFYETGLIPQSLTREWAHAENIVDSNGNVIKFTDGSLGINLGDDFNNDITEAAIPAVTPPDTPSDSSALVQNTRDTFQRNLDRCTAMKADLEQKLGQAAREYQRTLTDLHTEHEQRARHLKAELQRVTDVKESLDLAVARLNKSAG